jgi:predicted translin family RNA/ssDNA-binding protein
MSENSTTSGVIDCKKVILNLENTKKLHSAYLVGLNSEHARDNLQEMAEKSDMLESIISGLEEVFPGVSIEEAKEIMGNNFLGPEVAKTALGIEFKGEIPPIEFSPEILEKLKDTHRLVFYFDKFSYGQEDGIVMTGKKLYEMLYEILKGKKKDGAEIMDRYIEGPWFNNEKFFTEETPNIGWKLVSKAIIPKSTNKNYLEQTDCIAETIRNLYGDVLKIPDDVGQALKEWGDLKNDTEEYTKLQNDIVSSDEERWKSVGDALDSLKLTKMFRESVLEWFYWMVLNESINDGKIMNDHNLWTKSRTISGTFVRVDRSTAGGPLHIDGDWPTERYSDVGCVFSASKL